MEKTEKIIVLKNGVEAKLLESILNEKNIPHFLISHHDTALNGLWQVQKGWGHLEAPGEYKEEIISIYKEMNKTEE